MLMVSTDYIPGQELELLGLVGGSANRCQFTEQDWAPTGRREAIRYTEMMDEARELATQRMEQQAAELGADAVICVQYSFASIMKGGALVMAYGTAVRFKQARQEGEVL